MTGLAYHGHSGLAGESPRLLPERKFIAIVQCGSVLTHICRPMGCVDRNVAHPFTCGGPHPLPMGIDAVNSRHRYSPRSAVVGNISINVKWNIAICSLTASLERA